MESIRQLSLLLKTRNMQLARAQRLQSTWRQQLEREQATLAQLSAYRDDYHRGEHREGHHKEHHEGQHDAYAKQNEDQRHSAGAAGSATIQAARLDPSQLANRSRFLGRLEEAIAQQQQQLQQVEQQFVQAEAAWRRIYLECKALEELHAERAAEVAREAANRGDRASQDLWLAANHKSD